MSAYKINLKTIQQLAVDKMVHPLSGEHIYVVPESEIGKSRKDHNIVIVTLNCHNQLCRVAQHKMQKNKETGILERGPENLLFPPMFSEKRGLHIDAESMVKYERGSDQLKAILKFLSKPENKIYVDEKWLLDNSI
jgi:hypothetical protein